MEIKLVDKFGWIAIIKLGEVAPGKMATLFLLLSGVN